MDKGTAPCLNMTNDFNLTHQCRFYHVAGAILYHSKWVICIFCPVVCVNFLWKSKERPTDLLEVAHQSIDSLFLQKKTSILPLFFSSFFLEHTEEGRIRHSDASWTVCTLSCSTSPQCHVPQTFCSIAAHHSTIALVDAQLKVKTPHRPRRAHQPLDKPRERILHLSTHWDNDGVRQRVCGSLSQTQTHTELAGLWRWGALYLAASGRWSLNCDVTVGSAQSESRCVHVYRFSNSLFCLLMQQASTDTVIN